MLVFFYRGSRIDLHLHRAPLPTPPPPSSFFRYATVFAAAAWKHLFAADPLNRLSGERLCECVLRHGAAEDPLEMMANLLGGDRGALSLKGLVDELV